MTDLLDFLLDAAIIVNDKGVILYANESFASMTHAPLKRLLKGDKSLQDFIFLWDDFFLEHRYSQVLDSTLYKEIQYALPGAQSEAGVLRYCVRKTKYQEGEAWLVLLHELTLEKVLAEKYNGQLRQKEKVIDDLKVAQSELRFYSQKLEIIVAERTSELRKAMQLQTATLESLGQGFLTFDEKGVCGSYFSKICPQLFKKVPAGLAISEVLEIPGTENESKFKDWIEIIFMDSLPFPDAAKLCPFAELTLFDRIIKLEFFPLRNEKQVLKSVVLVATDITEQKKLEAQYEKQKEFSQILTKAVTSRKHFMIFVSESRRIIQEVDQELKRVGPGSEQDFKTILRDLHTLKGGSGFFGFQSLARLIHDLESEIKESGTLAGGGRRLWLRVQTEFAQQLKELEPFVQISDRLVVQKIEVAEGDLSDMLIGLSHHGATLPLAESLFSRYLCDPLWASLKEFEEESKAIMLKEGKGPLEVLYEGQNINLSTSIYRPLIASFVHAFRNSLDHGFSQSFFDHSKEKPTIRLKSEIISGSFLRKLRVTLQDNGLGINIQKFRNQLSAQGISEKDLSDKEILHYLFEDGISTREEVSTTSGRGVGLAALRAEARKLQGAAWAESEEGKGLRICVEVPFVDLKGYLKWKYSELKKVA